MSAVTDAIDALGAKIEHLTTVEEGFASERQVWSSVFPELYAA